MDSIGWIDPYRNKSYPYLAVSVTRLRAGTELDRASPLIELQDINKQKRRGPIVIKTAVMVYYIGRASTHGDGGW